MRAARWLEGVPSTIRLGNHWLDDWLDARDMGWVIAVEAWLRVRVNEQSEDPTRHVPQALLQCKDTGARPLSPIALLAAVLVGCLVGVTSLRDLERWASFDLRAIWILGGFCPDHSTFGRFLGRLHEHVSDELFERLTAEMIRAIGRRVDDVSADGTVMQAAASRYRRLKAEAIAQRVDEARRAVEQAPDDVRAARDLERALACALALAARQQAREESDKDPTTVTVCPSDPEAVVQKTKEGHFAPAVVASVIATVDRFVVATDVHPSDENASVAPMLTQAERLAVAVHTPNEPCEGSHPACEPRGAVAFASCDATRAELGSFWRCVRALARTTGAPCNAHAQVGALGLSVARMDGNYLVGRVLRLEQTRGVELRIAVGALAGSTPAPQGFRPDDPKAFDKSRFRLVVLPATDRVPERRCLVCPMGALLHEVKSVASYGANPAHVVYQVVGVRCSVCPYVQQCAPKTHRRRVSRYPDDGHKERMRDRLAAALPGQDRGMRAKSVEPIFSAFRGPQGLRRFHRRGVRGARLELNLHALSHNLRRFVSLAGWRRAL